MSYLRNAPSRRATPQSQPIPGSGQVPNSAGGHAWEVSPLTRLRRFLILGSEGGSYYASEQQLTNENVSALATCDPHEAIKLILDVSTNGLAPKQDPAIFALAYYAAHQDPKVRNFALSQLSAVCRTGTHLFAFLTFVQAQRGWGRSLRRAVGEWYTNRDPDKLAYQMVKYRQRDGWTHADALRLSHPTTVSTTGNPETDVSAWHARLFDWVAGRTPASEIGGQVAAFAELQAATDPRAAARLIVEHNLPREAVPTELLRNPEVWAALFDNMPLTAMIRNLPTMTRVGLLTTGSQAAQEVTHRLSSAEYLHRARVHPLSILIAMLTYQGGRSVRGGSTWQPVTSVIDAMDAAFYASFRNVDPTGKSYLLALDVSGSMDWGDINGIPGFTPRVAAAAMALVTMSTGDPCTVIGFASGQTPSTTWNQRQSGLVTPPRRRGRVAGVMPLTISPRQRLDDVCAYTHGLPFGGTDCALPAMYAQAEGLEVDCINIYTDSETWAGQIHPSQTLANYRRASGRDTAQVVVGMVSNGFSIADPYDVRQMDVVGFDASAPQIISDFAAGRV